MSDEIFVEVIIPRSPFKGAKRDKLEISIEKHEPPGPGFAGRLNRNQGVAFGSKTAQAQ